MVSLHPVRGARAVLFDLDDTLIVYNGVAMESWRRVCVDFAPQLFIDGDHLVAALHTQRELFWADDHSAMLARRDPQWGRIRVAENALKVAGADPRCAHLLVSRYVEIREEASCLMDGAVEVLGRLAAARIRLGLVTNGQGPTQRSKLARFGLIGAFDYIYIEGENGRAKPDGECFLSILRAMGVTPSDAVMVGDDFRRDIVGASAVGLATIWVNTTRVPVGTTTAAVADYMVASLSEVAEILVYD